MGTETAPAVESPARRARPGRVAVDWLTPTDHQKIGHLHLITSFVFVLAAVLMALMTRAEPAGPGLQLMTDEESDRAFTLHGTVTLLPFATPTFAGFATRSCRSRSAPPTSRSRG